MTNKIQQLRKEHQYTQAKLAVKLGITQANLSGWETNKWQPDQDSLFKMADIFGVTVDYLLGRTENNNAINIFDYENILPISKRRIPLLGDIACGKPIYAAEEKESYVLCGTDIQADFCLKAKGDSMINARILNGDIVFIRKQDIVENGEIAAVIIENEATLKRVYYYPEQGKLILQAENPTYAPLMYVGEELNQIHILGKAIAFQSDVK